MKNHCQCCPKACQNANIQYNCSIKYFLRGLTANDRHLHSLHYIKKVTRIAVLKPLKNSSHLKASPKPAFAKFFITDKAISCSEPYSTINDGRLYIP